MSNKIAWTEYILAEDSLITQAQFAIHNLLESKGVSRAELARRLEVSDAYVSQIFKDEPRNLTLKTVARIFRALGEEAKITSDSLARLMPAAYTPTRDRNKNAGIFRKFAAAGDIYHAVEKKPVPTASECNDNELELAA